MILHYFYIQYRIIRFRLLAIWRGSKITYKHIPCGLKFETRKDLDDHQCSIANIGYFETNEEIN